MANLYRLIALLVLALFSSPSMAIIPAVQGYHYSMAGTSPNETFQGLLTSFMTPRNYVASSCTGVWNNNTTTCTFTNSVGGQTGAQTITRTAVGLICPANSTLSGSNCVCNSTFQESGGVCVTANQALCTALSGTETYASAPGNIAPGAASCNATGCMTNFANTLIRVKNAQGQYVTEGAATFTGSVCTYSAASGSAADTCPGGSTGEVNGVTVCVPYDPKLNTVESVGGSESTVEEGGDITTTSTTSSTSCANGKCTTTTTVTTNVNGGTPSTKTTSTDEPQSEFCTKNPRAAQCQESGQFGGSCAAFTCSGDAVQCALTSEVHRQNCKMNAVTTESALYTSSKGAEAEFDNDDVVNIGPSSFSTTPVLGAASCITNKSITIMGSTVNLPFSDVCQYLAMLGNVLMAIGYLLSARIIIRG